MCEKYKHFDECKKTDATSLKRKHEAWSKIENEFNANSDVRVNKDSIKSVLMIRQNLLIKCMR